LYVGGYYRRTPNMKFTFMNVPKAGHYVPTNVIEVTKWMVLDIIFNSTLQCYNNQDGCGTAKMTCDYMN